VLLLQGRIEYVLLHYASRALYGTLLEAGVEIYEYHRSFLHAKVAVVDGHWATVGSSNIDPFSLLLAREANVIAEDRRFAVELRASLRSAIEQGARVVAKTRWFRQPLWRRLPIWLGYGLARLSVGLFGFGGRF
jgi:cardiolipin synthase